MNKVRKRVMWARGAVLLALPVIIAPAAWAAPKAPVVTSPEDGSLVGASTVHVTGTVDGSTASVRVLEGATVLAETGSPNGGFAVDVVLGDGTHVLTIRPFTSGGTPGADASVRVTVDTTPPAAPAITVPTNGAALAHSPVTVEGTSEPGASIRLTDETTGSRADTTAGPGGNWSVSVPLGDGTRVLRAVAVDAAGNVSLGSASTTITVDTRAPAVPVVTLPSEGSLHNVALMTFHGMAEPGVTIFLEEGTLLGTVVASGDGTWRKTLTLAEGMHAVTVRAMDAAGHPSGSVVRRFEVDLTPPAPPVILTPFENQLVASANIVVTGRAEPGSTVTLSRGGANAGTDIAKSDGSWFLVISAPEGLNEMTARARDLAGNIGSPSDIRRFKVDATPPELNIETQSGAIFLPLETPLTFGNPPRISGTASDDNAVKSVELAFYNALGRPEMSSRALCALCPTGKSVTWRTSESPLAGRFVVKAYAVDTVGNRSPEQQIVVTIVRTP